jgi:hypothetical protein
MVKPSIKVVGIPKLNKILTQAEQDFIKDLRAKAKTQMLPIASKVRSQIPTVAPIKGMDHNGRTQWAVPKVTVYSNPRTRAKRGRNVAPIMGFRATSPSRAVGFAYGELAGIRRKAPKPVSKGWYTTTVGGYHSYRVNGQGEAMIQRLEKIQARPGRFFYRHVRKYLPELRQRMLGIVEDTVKDLNRKLNS